MGVFPFPFPLSLDESERVVCYLADKGKVLEVEEQQHRWGQGP